MAILYLKKPKKKENKNQDLWLALSDQSAIIPKKVRTWQESQKITKLTPHKLSILVLHLHLADTNDDLLSYVMLLQICIEFRYIRSHPTWIS